MPDGGKTMKKTVLIFAVSFFSLFFISCSSDECDSKKREKLCEGTIAKQCLHDEDGFRWYEEDCSKACPFNADEVGGEASCLNGECYCAAPESMLCRNYDAYFCENDIVKQCRSQGISNGAIWRSVKNCAEKIPSDEITDGGFCSTENKIQDGEPVCSPRIKKAFRGKWHELSHEVSDYYFRTDGITVVNNNEALYYDPVFSKIDDNTLKMAKDSVESGNILVRIGINNAVLKLKVKRAGTSDGVEGVNVRIENTADSGEIYEQKSGKNGETEFKDIVAGEYVVSVGNTAVKQIVDESSDAGNFYYAQTGFIYKVTTSSHTIFYAENKEDSAKGNEYSIALSIHNFGDIAAGSTKVAVKTDDEAVLVNAEEKTLEMIGSGENAAYTFSMETLPFDKAPSLKDAAYHDVVFTVYLTDENDVTWEDTVTVRIYRKSLPVYLYSALPDTSHPFVFLSPERQNIAIENETWIPYRPDAKYIIIAQNMYVDTEGVYSIGVGSWDESKWDTDQKSFDDADSYEPNDSESQAKTVKMNSQTTSYLRKNDIDFWIIDMSGR